MCCSLPAKLEILAACVTGPGNRHVDVDSLAARLPESLSLDANTPDQSPRRSSRVDADHHSRRRDGSYKSAHHVRELSGARGVNNSKGKTKYYGVSPAFT